MILLFNKKLTQIFIILLLFIPITLLYSSKQTSYKDFNYNELLQTAINNGHINIIIKMDVPDIDRLTAESTKYKTGNSDFFYIQNAINADIELEKAISFTTDSVLYKLNNKSYEINHTFSTLPYLALNVSKDAIKSLEKAPEVVNIIEDKPIPLPYTIKINAQNENLKEPKLSDSTKIIGANDAWNMGFTGQGWYIVTIDTGIWRSHEFFTGKNIVEQCYSLENDCPNGNSSMSGKGAAAHYESFYAGYDHGTHVAGIACGNNKKGFYGVAKNANIIAIQVFSRFSAADCEGVPCVMSYDSDQLKALEFVYKKRNNYNIAAVNMSLGGDKYNDQTSCDEDYNLEKKAIDNLNQVGIATIIASGNEHYCDGICSPACISSAVAVGSTSKNDKESSFSNWDSGLLDLFAPGQSILSSTGNNNKSYAYWSGTSMATPHVTGSWALLKQCAQDLSFNEALNSLVNEGKPVKTKCSTGHSKPRIDIGKSIIKLIKLAPPINFSIEQKINYSLLQTEYLNVLTWEANPLNQGKNVVKYNIFYINGSEKSLITELDPSIFVYWDRKVNKNTEYTYGITSVNDEGDQSFTAFVTYKSE